MQSVMGERREVNGASLLRSLLTPVGWIEFLLPRVRCECGGSVELGLEGLMRPYQRLSDEVDAEIRHGYSLGLSLRQLERGGMERSYLGPPGRRTLLSRLPHLVALRTRSRPTPLPPVVQVDAIWATQVLPTEGVYRDRKGRQRPRSSVSFPRLQGHTQSNVGKKSMYYEFTPYSTQHSGNLPAVYLTLL